MGNNLGRKRTIKVMKINGETIKFKNPIHAGEIVKDFPGHVLLDSSAVKHFGIRAKPLEPLQELNPKSLYFLVELPKVFEQRVPRKVRSGIQMSAKDRLESLMLARRSVSDLSPRIVVDENGENLENGVTRIKMRIPKAEVERLMSESKDEAEAAEKIVGLCVGNEVNAGGGDAGDWRSTARHGALLPEGGSDYWKGDREMVKSGVKSREKRVGFLPISEGEIQLAVAS